MALQGFDTSNYVASNAGLGNFIRNKLAIARDAGLTTHKAEAYGDQSVRAAEVAAKYKAASDAPMDAFSQQVIDQYAPVDPVTGQRDFSRLEKVEYDPQGRPMTTRLKSTGGLVVPERKVGSDLDFIQQMMGGGMGQFTPTAQGQGQDPQVAAILQALENIE